MHYRACGVTPEGRGRCWGRNGDAAFGRGVRTTSKEPRFVRFTRPGAVVTVTLP